MTPAIAGTELDRAITSNGSLSHNGDRGSGTADWGLGIGVLTPPEVAADETLDAIDGHFRLVAKSAA